MQLSPTGSATSSRSIPSIPGRCRARFAWNLFLVCGYAEEADTYFAGWQGPVAPISCPDNVAFDSVGNLRIATDGAPASLSKADGLFRVPLEGADRGHVVQFLAVPVQAETCGPVIHDRVGRSLSACSIPVRKTRGTASCRSFPTMFRQTLSRHGEPGADRGQASFR